MMNDLEIRCQIVPEGFSNEYGTLRYVVSGYEWLYGHKLRTVFGAYACERYARKKLAEMQKKYPDAIVYDLVDKGIYIGGLKAFFDKKEKNDEVEE